MKFLVDQLPTKCGECDYCAEALLQTPLGVKEVNLCTMYTVFVPQRPDMEPKTIDPEKSPEENDCLCKTNGASKLLTL